MSAPKHSDDCALLDSMCGAEGGGGDCTRHVADLAEMRREAARLRAERDNMRRSAECALGALGIASAALTRLRDCDWTIGRGDRMDPVRDIAREALEKMEEKL